MPGQPHRAGSMPFQPSGGNGAILAIHSSCAAFPTELRFFRFSVANHGEFCSIFEIV
ncbi:hypothetical protein KDW23_01995 [Burkholderia cenocepacia]|uniref:hypothetical protein n=1 Tax=Burkholderia cenocepacia TaxID=95486 RepID=UPI001B91EE28|nr:hypothetical protein [Burkholderia cenocepacia]MBR8073402.1 hypothetical protein [Burkholderia cenocepacia]MBR8443465.1 hypothetical protein [Burkholderia cenocepacia]